MIENPLKTPLAFFQVWGRGLRESRTMLSKTIDLTDNARFVKACEDAANVLTNVSRKHYATAAQHNKDLQGFADAFQHIAVAQGANPEYCRKCIAIIENFIESQKPLIEQGVQISMF